MSLLNDELISRSVTHESRYRFSFPVYTTASTVWHKLAVAYMRMHDELAHVREDMDELWPLPVDSSVFHRESIQTGVSRWTIGEPPGVWVGVEEGNFSRNVNPCFIRVSPGVHRQFLLDQRLPRVHPGKNLPVWKGYKCQEVTF